MSKRSPPKDGASSQDPVRLVVKHTFLELENSGQSAKEKATGRRKSDSSCVPSLPEGEGSKENGEADEGSALSEVHSGASEEAPVQGATRHGRYRDSVMSIMTNNGFDGPSDWSSTRRGSMESGPRGSWQSSSRRSSASSRPWSGYQEIASVRADYAGYPPEHYYPQPFYAPASGYDATSRVPLSTAPMGPSGPPPPGYGHPYPPPPPHMLYGGYPPDPGYPPMPRHYPHHHHHHPPPHPGYYPPAMPPPSYGCPYCYPPPPGPGYLPPPGHGHPGQYQPPPPVYDIREHRPQWLFPDGDQEGGTKRTQRERDAGRERESDRSRQKTEGGRQRAPLLQSTSVGCRTTYTPVKTTVMVRNIPPGYTRNKLTDLLDSKGMSGQYDFVYMPMNFRTKASFGYAFVNLVSPEAAEECHTKFNGFKDWGLESDKICEVSWSDMHQGLDAHIERYRNSPVMHTSVPDEYKPVMFSEGKRIEFPPPSKKIRQPRIRRSSDGSLEAGDDDDEDDQDEDGEEERGGDRMHPPPPSMPPPAAPTPPLEAI